MKRYLCLFLFLVSGILVFADEAMAEKHLREARNYEKKGKLYYALTSYYEAMIEAPENPEYVNPYQEIKSLIESGKPGKGNFNEFEAYEKWYEFLIDKDRYYSENSPFVFFLQKAEKNTNYEEKTATYTFDLSFVNQNKDVVLCNLFDKGLRTSKMDNSVRDSYYKIVANHEEIRKNFQEFYGKDIKEYFEKQSARKPDDAITEETVSNAMLDSYNRLLEAGIPCNITFPMKNEVINYSFEKACYSPSDSNNKIHNYNHKVLLSFKNKKNPLELTYKKSILNSTKPVLGTFRYQVTANPELMESIDNGDFTVKIADLQLKSYLLNCSLDPELNSKYLKQDLKNMKSFNLIYTGNRSVSENLLSEYFMNEKISLKKADETRAIYLLTQDGTIDELKKAYYNAEITDTESTRTFVIKTNEAIIKANKYLSLSYIANFFSSLEGCKNAYTEDGKWINEKQGFTYSNYRTFRTDNGSQDLPSIFSFTRTFSQNELQEMSNQKLSEYEEKFKTVEAAYKRLGIILTKDTTKSITDFRKHHSDKYYAEDPKNRVFVYSLKIEKKSPAASAGLKDGCIVIYEEKQIDEIIQNISSLKPKGELTFRFYGAKKLENDITWIKIPKNW